MRESEEIVAQLCAKWREAHEDGRQVTVKAFVGAASGSKESFVSMRALMVVMLSQSAGWRNDGQIFAAGLSAGCMEAISQLTYESAQLLVGGAEG